ncbi:MAG: fluoride efflux transporter CrcB [Proteobacteria bacterium]|nr:fluoride efflux transporter CrcB [Pseudomonadota bacterium]
MGKILLAIAVGSSLGGILRWGLSVQLNAHFPGIPPGTLVANLVAAFVVGAAIGYFAEAPAIAPEWRLLIITGFCGGLSTFSTFSAEVVLLLQAGRVSMAAGAIALHMLGSFAMTIAGIAGSRWLFAH